MVDPTISRPPPVDVVPTADGTPTLRRADSGWSYRSEHGAWAEASHVFVRGTGLHTGSGARRVLELGFGAGTNFAATVVARRDRGPLTYCAVEHAPVAAADLPAFDALAHRLATTATRDGRAEAGEVTLALHVGEFVDAPWPGPFDAVFVDPFGPREQPDSWSRRVLQLAADRLAPDGRLATYSAAGEVRRTLAAAGLYVATAPGPRGKREFSIAAHRREALAGLQLRNAP